MFVVRSPYVGFGLRAGILNENASCMIRILREKNTDYTIISNIILRDTSVSLKAKGLMAMVMSLPDDWDFSISGVLSIVKEKRDSIYSILSELKEKGYCKIVVTRNENGKITGTDYIFIEHPILESDTPQSKDSSDISPLTEKPYTEKPYTEKPYTAKPTQLIKDRINYLNRIKERKKEKEKDEKEKEASDEPTLGLSVAEPLPELETPSKPDKKALDLSLVDADFLPIVEDWLDYKKERRETYKPRGFDAFYKRLVKLSGGNASKAREIIEQSKANNYAGIFPIKSGRTDNLPVGYILREENMGKKKTSEW